MSLPDPLKLAEALNPPKSLREFNHRFRTEADCEDFLFLVRYPEGFVCPRCGVRQGWALEDKRLTECSSGHKVSLTSGTAFHRTRQDLLTWFHAVFLISTLTPGISGTTISTTALVNSAVPASAGSEALRDGLSDVAHSPIDAGRTRT